MSAIKSYVLFVLVFQMAFVIVAPTGIFPNTMELSTVDAYEKMMTNFNEIKGSLSNINGVLGYTELMYTLITNGAAIIINLIDIATSGIPDIMNLIGFPKIICTAIQIPIAGIVIYELAILLRNGGTA